MCRGFYEVPLAARVPICHPQDIRAWPIRGIVVFAGAGFSSNMRAYLLSTGVAVEFEDVQTWLDLYFGL